MSAQCATTPVKAMAKTTAPPEQTAPATPEATPTAKLPLKKLIMFGVPLFIVQLVLVYFLITKVLAPAPASSAEPEHSTSSESSEKEKGKKSHGSEGKEGKEGEGGGDGKIYVVKDLIVNPAGTNGTRFLLTTVGFEVTTPEALKDIESKDMMVRDALNTILTSKDLASLVNVEGRELLRKEIQEKVGVFVHDGELSNVYFSKFIIQ
jgi:flagellar protein FliL